MVSSQLYMSMVFRNMKRSSLKCIVLVTNSEHAVMLTCSKTIPQCVVENGSTIVVSLLSIQEREQNERFVPMEATSLV